MARFPGTEVQTNRSGFRPGQVVRFRRSRANGEMGLADHRGFLSEVRPGHVRVLLDAAGRGQWIESQAVLPEGALQDPELDALRRTFQHLGALRLEVDGDEWAFFTEGFDAQGLADAREALGDRHDDLALAAFGVHEMVVRVRLRPAAGAEGAGAS